MKNLITSIIIIFTSLIFHGQSPSKINYQVVVRDANGNILPNTSVPITISLVNGINTCSVYNGNQNTNSYGLINLELDLSACTIDWSPGTTTLSSSIILSLTSSSSISSII